MRTLARWAGSSGFPWFPRCQSHLQRICVWHSFSLVIHQRPHQNLQGCCWGVLNHLKVLVNVNFQSCKNACYPWVRNSPTLTRRSYSMHWPKSSCDFAYCPTSAFFGQKYLNLPYIVDAMGMYQIWFLNPHWKFNFSAACGGGPGPMWSWMMQNYNFWMVSPCNFI